MQILGKSRYLNYNPKKRYRVTGEYDPENRVMYFDMTTGEETALRNTKEE